SSSSHCAKERRRKCPTWRIRQVRAILGRMRRPAGPFFLLLVLAAGASSPACRRQQATQSENDLLVPVAVEPAALGMIRGVVSATGLVTALPGAEFLVFAPQTARIAEITKAVGDSA